MSPRYINHTSFINVFIELKIVLVLAALVTLTSEALLVSIFSEPLLAVKLRHFPFTSEFLPTVGESDDPFEGGPERDVDHGVNERVDR